MRRCAGCLPPCRCLAGLRSTRVDFSMGTMNRCISFRPHLTRRMGSADTARQLRVTTFDHSTSTTTNRPPDQHFHPIFVVRIDGKWVCGWYLATAGRPAHSPGEWRRFFRKEHPRNSENAVKVKIGRVGHSRRHASCKKGVVVSVPIEAGGRRVCSGHI